MKAALLDNKGKVVGEVFDAPESGSYIPIAGAFTVDNDPVNITKYKISRSVKNLEKAQYEQPVSLVNCKHGKVWTFHAVVNDTVVY